MDTLMEDRITRLENRVDSIVDTLNELQKSLAELAKKNQIVAKAAIDTWQLQGAVNNYANSLNYNQRMEDYNLLVNDLVAEQAEEYDNMATKIACGVY